MDIQMKNFKEFITEGSAKVTANRGSLGALYIDMDGVLADFRSGASAVLGLKFPGRGRKLTDAEWKQIDGTPGFWEGLPVMKDAKKLWNFIRPHKPNILSAAPQQWDEAVKGKKTWLKNNLGNVGGTIHIVKRKDKQLYAKGNVLVDDHQKNITEWEAAGGIGILHTSVKKTIDALKKLGYG